MADIKDVVKRSENMAAIRSRDTKPELFIRKLLFRDGFRYRIAPNTVPGHPDLFLRKYNLAIFVHGCFWHRHKECRYAYVPKSRTEFWETKFRNNVQRDLTVQAQLKEKGIRCLILWECAIRQAQKRSGNPEHLISCVEDFIRSDQSWGEVSGNAVLQTRRYDSPCI